MSKPYDAFISYRRSDGTKVANWLRRELESFRPPTALRQHVTQPLRVYLDTAYEQGTSDFYRNTIYPALMSSRFLVVLATPAAIRRADGAEDWIQREVSDFCRGPNARNVLVVRAAGEFLDPLPADLATRFPNIEIVDLRGAGPFWYLNPLRASRLAAEKLKLVAPLCSIPSSAMPLLRQDEERRQQTRMGVTAGLAAAIATAVSATSIFALQSSIKANRALEDSLFAAGRMVLTTASGLTASGNAVRSNILNQGCDLIDKLAREAGRPLSGPEIVVCATERAQSLRGLGETAAAQAILTKAMNETAASNERYPSETAAAGVLEALRAVADHLLEQNDTAGASSHLDRLVTEGRRFRQRYKDSIEIGRPIAEALALQGDIALKADRPRDAELQYVAAADAFARSPLPHDVMRRAWMFQQAAVQRLTRQDAKGARTYLDNALELYTRIPANSLTVDASLNRAETQTYLASLLRAVEDPGWQTAVRQASASLTTIAPRVSGRQRERLDELTAHLRTLQ